MTDPERLEAIRDKLKAGKRLSKAERAAVDQASEEARFLPTLEAVALRFGATRKALDKWKPYDTEKALERTEQGYDLDAIKRLRTRMHAEGKNPRLLAGDDTGGGDLDPQALKARKLFLDCEKVSVQIDVLRKLYIKLEDALAEVRTIIFATKQVFSNLPAEAAYTVSGVTPAEAEQSLREMVNARLTKLEQFDYQALHERLTADSDIDDMPSARMPAARELNGAQKA
jgi:hypothetical protein